MRRALIVIDAQQEYFTGNLPIEHPDPAVSIANIGRAMDAAREAGIPVIVVQNRAGAAAPAFVPGTEGWELHEAVRSRPHDLYLEKALPSAFAGTALADWLASRGVDTLAVAGYMTHNCDASTINHAFHLGLQVEFLSDASGAVPYENAAGAATAEEIHRVFCVVLQSRFAAVMTTAAWIGCLEGGAEPVRDTIVGSNRRARARAQVQAG